MAGVLVNGVNYAWANVTWLWFSVPVVGITEISFDKEAEKENNYGAGNEPISRAQGNNKYSASIEIYEDEWRKLVLASPNNDPLEIPPSDMIIVLGGSRVNIQATITLQAAEIMKDTFTVKQGDKMIKRKIPLIIAGIVNQ
ncbi:MAG: hypothetical protein KGI54_17355 [Pseudomonadota bacterium]|nr:hypothetical protein [Pseudomonadota bacterium]